VFPYNLIIVHLVIGELVTSAEDCLKKMATELAAIPEVEREASWLIRDASLKEFGLLHPYQSISKLREATLDRMGQTGTNATKGADVKGK